MSTVSEPTALRNRYDKVSPKYDRGEYSDVSQRLLWLIYDQLTWSPVERMLPSGQTWRVLDAGGGGGKFGPRFAEKGHHVTVLDISPGMLEQAQKAFTSRGLTSQATFVEGTITALPFADSTFDLVFCEGDPVSYCLDEYPKAISELVRVAVPRGPVVMGLDNRLSAFLGTLKYGKPPDALSVLLTGKTWCPYGLPVHAFTVEELHRAVTAGGAEVEEIFGKPIMFFELLEALKAARGPAFDPWDAREEILALQERMAHGGYAVMGAHLQVMARRK